MILKIIKKKIVLIKCLFIYVLGGYSQVSAPEYTTFEPVNSKNMVQLNTGDFIYNIPLFNIPGAGGEYPVNIFYHGGITMDQDASWTGLGWNINVGAIERTVKGYPDDFNGKEINVDMFKRDVVNKQIRSLDLKKNNIKIGKGVSFGFSIPSIGLTTSYDKRPIYDFSSSKYTAYGPLYFSNAKHLKNPWGTQKRDVDMDVYSNPQNGNTQNYAEENDKANNLSFPSYDNYVVTANGLIGVMSPKLFEFGTLCKRGYTASFHTTGILNEYSTKDEYDYNNRYDFTKTSDKIHFYFEGEPSGFLKIKNGVFSLTSGSDPIWSNAFSGGGAPEITNPEGKSFYDAVKNRKGEAKYIQWYTNLQMQNNQLTLADKGIMEYEKLKSARSNTEFFDPDGIGGYSITDENGVTYHYALPVYNFSEHRINENVYDPSTDWNSYFLFSKYATSWLLTAITGADFIDKGQKGIVDDADEGYWVKFDYGKWSDGYLWQTPFSGVERLEDDRSSYAIGRKQIYYLNSIRTKTHTAYFIKELREDGWGKESFIDKLHMQERNLFEAKGIMYRFLLPDKGRVLRLAKIILLKNEDLTITSNAGSPLINTQGGIVEKDSWKAKLGEKEVDHEYTLEASFNFNYNDNVTDINDIQALTTQIKNKAIKVVNFEYDYSLCKNAPNGAPATLNGKLTLKSIGISDGTGVLDAPKYKFDYYNTTNYQSEYKDYWGYYTGPAVQDHNIVNKDLYAKPDANSWSLKEINTPMGGKLKISYESDTYGKVGSQPKSDVKLSINNLSHPGGATNYLTMRLVSTIASIAPGIVFELNKYYNIQYRIHGTKKIVNGGILEIIPEKNYSGYNKLIAINAATSELTFETSTDIDLTAPQAASVDAIKLPLLNNNNGGGVRVNKIETIDENNVVTSTEYDYTDPFTGYSSGFTSYIPVKDKDFYIPYVYELPAPNVIYKYVTVRNVGSNGKKLGDTRYKFHTLDDYASLNGLNYTMGDFINVKDIQPNTELFTSILSTAAIHSYARSVLVTDFTSSLGRPLSIQAFDPNKNLLSEITYEYYSPNELKAGITQETYAMVKQYTHWDQLNHSSYSQFHYMCASSKIVYPSVLKSTTTNQKGILSKITNTAYDFRSGAITETEETNSLGEKFRTKLVPAYSKSQYSLMDSKLAGDTYKNMLAPITASYNYFVDQAGVEKRVSASVETWKNTWTYRDFISSNYTDNVLTDVWRKHQSYAWKTDVNNDGTFAGTFTDFDWGGTPNAGWLKTNEITRYDHYSDVLETKDVNGNFSSSKKGDTKENLTIATSSASDYINFIHTSFEEFDNGFVGGEARITECSTCLQKLSAGIKAHTGNYYIEQPSTTVGPTYLISNALCSGKTYELSVWKHKNSGSLSFTALLDGTVGTPQSYTLALLTTSTLQVGDWILVKATINIPSSYTPVGGPAGINGIKIWTVASGGPAYIDDFRVQPVNSNVSGYVYDKSKKLLTATLDNENFATIYTYDSSGRLIKTEKETAQGIKKISETKYHYGRP